MRSLNSVFRLLNKHSLEYFDLDHLRNVAKYGNLKLRTVMHLEFIKHHGVRNKSREWRRQKRTQTSRLSIRKFLKTLDKRTALHLNWLSNIA